MDINTFLTVLVAVVLTLVVVPILIIFAAVVTAKVVLWIFNKLTE